MQGVTTDVLVVVIGAIIAALLAAIGYLLRRFVGSLDVMRKDVRQLADQSVRDQAIAPDRARRLQDAEDLLEEHTTQLAVLHNWQVLHDQHHDRRRYPQT